MFNNLRKFLREGESHNKQSLNSCFCSLITAFVLVSGAINIARADVCFLPDSKGCEMVPYEEYACTGDDCNQEPAQECKASNYCYATEAEAIAARGVTVTRSRPGSAIMIISVYDSYEKSGDCYCLKNSCGKILSNILMVQREGYDLSEAKGEGWNCEQCKDTNSQFYNNYRCTAKECVENSSVSCVTDGDACKTCVDRGYSGDNVCQELQTIAAHCPEGYVPEEPAGGCYSTQDMICGEGKCYKATETPECGEGKRLAKANGVCSCECYLKDVTPKIGYTIDLEKCEEIPIACPSYASTDCVPDECHECNSINSLNPVYSGEKECLIYSTVDEHCPEGYVPNKPNTKCYSTQDMLCGEGKCYQAATTIPDCSGRGKKLFDNGNGACWCKCKTGYHPEGSVLCIPNQKKKANVTISYDYLADPNGPTWHYGGILYSKVSSSGFDNGMVFKVVPGIRLMSHLQSAGYNDEGQPMCGGQGFTLMADQSISGFCDNTYHNESLVAEGSQGYNIVGNKIANGDFNEYYEAYLDRVEGIFEMSTDGTAPRVVSGKGSCSGNQCQCFSADCTFSYYDSSSEYWEIKFSQTHSSSQGINPPRGCIITVDCTFYNRESSALGDDAAKCTLTKEGGYCAFTHMNIPVNCDYSNMMGTIRPVDASITMSLATTTTIAECPEYIRDDYNISGLLHLQSVHFGNCTFVKYGGTSSSHFDTVNMTPSPTSNDGRVHYSCSKTYTE